MATENYLLSIGGIAGASFNECVLCFQSAGLSSNDTLDAAGDLINAFNAHAATEWLACLPGTYFLQTLTARRAFPKPSATAVAQNQPFTVGGTVAGDMTSLSLCPSVFLVPPMTVKTGGKIFMPCVAQSQIVDNTYAAGYVTAIDALMTKLTTGLAGSGTSWKLAIYSRKNISASLVLSWVLSPRIGFQGRRRKPVGVN